MTLLEEMARRGIRPTGPRALVAQNLPAEGSFRADDLLAVLREGGHAVGRATVFRTLALLTGRGLLERIADLDGGVHYRVCAMAGSHHHHLTCTACGAGVVVEDERLEAVLRAVTEAQGFTPKGHRVELYGLCPSCREDA